VWRRNGGAIEKQKRGAVEKKWRSNRGAIEGSSGGEMEVQ
jgi:hypothetical protein